MRRKQLSFFKTKRKKIENLPFFSMKRRRRSNSVPSHLNDDSSEQSNPSRTVSRRTSVVSTTSGVSTAARTSGMITSDHFDPSLVGMVVPPHTRRAGKYLLGPKLGVSPVKSIVQCLARLENSDQYFQVKLLTLYSGTGRHVREETQVFL